MRSVCFAAHDLEKISDRENPNPSLTASRIFLRLANHRLLATPRARSTRDPPLLQKVDKKDFTKAHGLSKRPEKTEIFIRFQGIASVISTVAPDGEGSKVGTR